MDDDAVRCTECEEIELARVRDQRPLGTMPLPAEALLGFPQGSDARTLSRRRLLRNGVAALATVYGSTRLPWESIWEAAIAEAAAGPQRAVVLLYLAGGNDGLGTMVPLGAQHSLLATHRPDVHRPLGPTVGTRVGVAGPLAGLSDWGLANCAVSAANGGDITVANQGLDVLWGSGNPANPDARLALFPAADYQPPNLSHFSSSDFWFAGALKPMSTGWAGRWLDLYGSQTNPLQGVSIDEALSKAMRTAGAPVASIASIPSVGFFLAGPTGTYPGPGGPEYAGIDPAATMRALSGVPRRASNTHLDRVRSTYGLATDVIGQLAPLAAAAAGANYPANSPLAAKLQTAAVVLGARLGTRIVTVHWGAFDTHAGQNVRHDRQLKELATCLSAFQADLSARGVEQDVVTLVYSEFGRRVRENASNGTDHGAGGLMGLVGSAVRGGLASAPPNIADLDARGNVKVETDFRSVYAAIISDWLGGDPAAVMPDFASVPALGRSMFR